MSLISMVWSEAIGVDQTLSRSVRVWLARLETHGAVRRMYNDYGGGERVEEEKGIDT